MVRYRLHHELRRLWKAHSETFSVILCFLLLTAGFLALGYGHPTLPFNTYIALASVLFFAALYLLLSLGPLREAFELFRGYLVRPMGALLFVVYLALHYVLYGIFLERILIGVYGYAAVNGSATIYLSSVLYTPVTVPNVFLSLFTGPTLVLWYPPAYGISLASFSLFFGFLIAVLVTANVAVVAQARACPPGRRWSSLVVLPAVGVVVGASCCLSLPVLIALIVPVVGVAAYSLWASYAAFFLFPIAAVVALAFNLRLSAVLIGRWNLPEERVAGVGE